MGAISPVRIEAKYYRREGDRYVCELCPHSCRIPVGGVIKRNKQTRNKCVEDCPYGAHWPCIGWCTRKILQKKGN